MRGSLQCCAPVGWSDHLTAKKATTQVKTRINFDHEIMENGIICSNLVEKSHHSSSSEQNPEGGSL
jgi:hypothetical protein